MKTCASLLLALILVVLPCCALANTLSLNLDVASPEELIAAKAQINLELLARSAVGALEKASRRAPALAGQVVTASMNGFDASMTYYTAKIAISMDATYRGEAFDQLVGSGFLRELSSPDREYVGVKFTASYIETVDDGGLEDPEFMVSNIFSFNIYTGSGAKYDTWSGDVHGQKALTNIREGGTTEGFLCFEVDKDDAAPYVVFTDSGYPATEVWFLVQ
jgi:hypothetical protein